MSEFSSTNAIVTPEAVAVRIDVAGLGSRMIALVIDSLIQSALLLGAGLAFGIGIGILGTGHTAGTIAFIVVVFVVMWGYFPIFELAWGGRTPGKRTQRLRVVQIDGQPARAGAIVARNILRFVDFLPLYYATGAITILLSKRSQRIGDMAAGTLVVRETAAPPPSPSPVISQSARAIAGSLDTSRLTERDYDVIRAFLLRRATLDPSARAALAQQLSTLTRQRVPEGAFAATNDEEFLEAVARAYRDRFSTGEEPPPPYAR